jgi:hypothetical protein
MIEISIKNKRFVVANDISDLMIAIESANVNYCVNGIDLYICRILKTQYISIMLNNEFVCLGDFSFDKMPKNEKTLRLAIVDLLNSIASKVAKINELIKNCDAKIAVSTIVGNLSIIDYKSAKITISFSSDCKVILNLSQNQIALYTKFNSNDLRAVPYIDFCKTIDSVIESAKETYMQLDKISLFHRLFK